MDRQSQLTAQRALVFFNRARRDLVAQASAATSSRDTVRTGRAAVERARLDVHYKHDQQAPMTACLLKDRWVIWSPIYEQVTCPRCVDMMDMRPA